MTTTDAMAVLQGMYAAEARYLAAGAPGVASFEPLAPFFARQVRLLLAGAFLALMGIRGVDP
ncbi:MAG: hypothetical protein ACRDRG_19435 [Pseudonocardiaceae bacterium]